VQGRRDLAIGRKVAEGVAVALAYYLCAKLGLQLAHVGSNVTLVWPSTGIAVAAFLRLGLWCWPGIFAAAALINIQFGTPLWAATIMGVGNTAGPFLVGSALRKLGFRPFERVRDTLAFLVAAPVGMLVPPTVGLGAMYAAGFVSGATFGPAWLMWWVGDLNGVLVVGPVLLAANRNALRELWERKAELAFIAAIALGTAFVAFFVIRHQLAFVVLLPVVWSALRFPGLGSSGLVLTMAAAAVSATVSLRGPFAQEDVHSGLLVLSGFLGSAALGNLIVIALLAEQRQDAAARVAAEQAKRSADERLSQAAKLAGLGTWEVDARSGDVTVSDELAELLGLRSAANARREDVVSLVHAEDRVPLQTAIRTTLEGGPAVHQEVRLDCADGRTRTFLIHANRLGSAEQPRIVGATLDITLRKDEEAARQQLERQLAESHRMEALGRMAGGIAHDFNNLLAAILPNVELLSLDIGKAHPARESVEGIYVATLRARELVKQILAFARQRNKSDRVVDLASAVDEVLRVMRANLPRNVELIVDVSDQPRVYADPSRLHQTVANLVTNAIQSMSDAGGKLDIRLTETTLDEPSAAPHGIEPGRYARLDVLDTGRGIEPGSIERIFDPFFTTKGAGGGTGLGLSVVHAVVRSYGGAVSVESTPAKGSRFTVFLPATAGVLEPEEADGPARTSPRGQGQILVVDDEPTVLQTTRRVLERFGYSVIAASSGRAALAELTKREPRTHIDLLLTDLSMPEMTGIALAREVRKLSPDLPIIIVTGNGAALDAAEVSALRIHEILDKPASSDVLANTLRDALA
jgi:PAS domain S-box-containing protein